MNIKVLFLAVLLFEVVQAQTYRGDSLSEVIVVDSVTSTESVVSEDIIPTSFSLKIISRGSYASELVIRGLTESRMALTIDGMALYSACPDRMDPVTSYFSQNNFAGVEDESVGVGFGVGKGANLMFARAPLSNQSRTRHQLGLHGNTNGMGRDLFLNRSFSSNKLGYLISYSFQDIDDYRDGSGQRVEHTQFTKQNLFATVTYKPKENALLFGHVVYDVGSDIGYAGLPMDVQRVGNFLASAEWRKYPTSSYWTQWSLKSYFQSVSHLMTDADREVEIRMDMPGWTQSLGASFRANRKVKKGSLDLVVHARSARQRAEMTMYPENEAEMYMLTWPDVRSYALNASLVKTVKMEKSVLTMNGGVSVNASRATDSSGIKQFEGFGEDLTVMRTKVLGQAGLSFLRELNKRWSMSSIVEWKQREVSTSELYGFYLYNSMDGYDYVGDPNLSPESTVQFELKVNRKTSRFDVELSSFYWRFSNYVLGEVDPVLDAMTMGANGVKRYVSNDMAEMYGGELMTNMRWSRIWSSGMVFELVQGYDDQGVVLPQMMPFNYSFSSTMHKPSFDLLLEWRGQLAKEVVRESFGENPSKSFGVVNAKIKKQIERDRFSLTLNASALNIFDSYYVPFTNWGGFANPGRSFKIGATLSFG